jgi:EAL domain-containing protein (putative c-di-GMP-specific phosphodiesterase class I)
MKIDQSFVKEIHDGDGHYPVILAIISIARGLNLHLVAEGVETETQADYLRSNGCETMQGYLFHRPISLSNFIGVLRAQAPLPGAPLGNGQPLVFPTPRALRA